MKSNIQVLKTHKRRKRSQEDCVKPYCKQKALEGSNLCAKHEDHGAVYYQDYLSGAKRIYNPSRFYPNR